MIDQSSGGSMSEYPFDAALPAPPPNGRWLRWLTELPNEAEPRPMLIELHLVDAGPGRRVVARLTRLRDARDIQAIFASRMHDSWRERALVELDPGPPPPPLTPEQAAARATLEVAEGEAAWPDAAPLVLPLAAPADGRPLQITLTAVDAEVCRRNSPWLLRPSP